MTIHEVTSAFLSTIPPQPPRPAHISDLEFAEIYKAALRGIKSYQEQGPARRIYLSEANELLKGLKQQQSRGQRMV